jgi:tungstate transport system substrate-binding protein
LAAALAAAVIAGLPGAAAGDATVDILDLATTTSVRDSGLLDHLLPAFEERSGLDVRVIAVGTGAALRMGNEGNADVLLTHAPSAEEKLVASRAVVSRKPFMENFFVIAGPPEDLAGVANATSAADAYAKLARTNAPYVSRSDDSGTHKREVALMRSAGIDPADPWPGVARTGSGMGLTLQVAGERRAYVLSDIGTYLAFAKRIGLEPHTGTDPELRNIYSVMRVNRDPLPDRRVRSEALRPPAVCPHCAGAGDGAIRGGSPNFGPRGDPEALREPVAWPPRM